MTMRNIGVSMSEDNFDFSELELHIDDRTDSQRRKDKRNEELAKVLSASDKAQAAANAVLQQELGYVPKLMKKPVYLPNSDTKHDIGAPQYQARLDAMMYIIRHPEIASKQQVKSLAWKQVSNLPYIKYIFEYDWIPEHKAKLRHVLFEQGIKCERISSSSIIKAVDKFYRDSVEHKLLALEVENELLRTLSNYEFTMDTSNNAILFKEFTLHWSSNMRAYHINIGGKDVKIPVGAKNKFIDAFELLTKLSET